MVVAAIVGRATPTLCWEVEPRTDPSPVGYFWSHQVALIGGEAAYFGLQTRGLGTHGQDCHLLGLGCDRRGGPEYAAPFRRGGHRDDCPDPLRVGAGSTRADGLATPTATGGGVPTSATSSLAGSESTRRGAAWRRRRSCGPSATCRRYATAPTSGTPSPGSARPWAMTRCFPWAITIASEAAGVARARRSTTPTEVFFM